MQFHRPPVSDIPETVEDWDFSFARHEADQNHPYGRFRWRLGGDEWICNKMFGELKLNGCLPSGHMSVRGRLLINEDGNAYYAGED